MGHIIPYSYGNPAAMGGVVVIPPVLVQQKDGGGATDVLTVTLDAPPAAGNSLIVTVACVNTSEVVGIETLAPETFTDVLTRNGTGVRTGSWILHNIADPTAVVNISLDISGLVAALVTEWSGLANAAAEHTNSNVGVADAAVTTGSADPTSGNNLVIAAVGTSTAVSVSSGPTNGFAGLAESTSGGAIRLYSAYLVRPADHAAISTGWTMDAATNWSAVIAGFGGSG